MEKRFNYNKEVDDMTKINAFFQNYRIPSEEELLRTSQMQQVEIEQIKSA